MQGAAEGHSPTACSMTCKLLREADFELAAFDLMCDLSFGLRRAGRVKRCGT